MNFIQSERLGCENVEMNIQVGHVHLLIKVPAKVSISSLMGVMKGQSVIRVFSKFPELYNVHFGVNILGRRVLC